LRPNGDARQALQLAQVKNMNNVLKRRAPITIDPDMPFGLCGRNLSNPLPEHLQTGRAAIHLKTSASIDNDHQRVRSRT
jgi:hypothetical protein